MHVSEVLPNRQAWEGKTLQLHGYVIPGSIFRKADSLDTGSRFKTRRFARLAHKAA